MKKKIAMIVISLFFWQSSVEAFLNYAEISQAAAGGNMAAFSQVSSTVAIVMVVSVPVTSVIKTSKAVAGGAEKRLVAYMKVNHDNLVHDIANGQGVLIEQWAHELNLSTHELSLVEKRLDASAEQQALLSSLNGEITIEDARAFSENVYQVFAAAVGKEKLDATLEALVVVEND